MDPFTVDEETEDDEETEGEAEDYIPVEGSTRVSQNGAVTSDQAISVNGGSGEVLALRVSAEGFQEGGGEMRRVEGGEISAMGSSSSSNGGETQEGSDGWVQDQIDGLCCPICMEAWTSGGEHQVWLVYLLLFTLYSSDISRVNEAKLRDSNFCTIFNQ